MLRSALAAIAVAVLASASAPVAAAQKYVVLSLIGDAMTLVTYRASVGSMLDRNDHQSVPLGDPAFDRAAAKAVEDALLRVDRENSVIVLGSSSPDLFTDQARLFDGTRVVLGDELGTSLRNSGASQMILITKHRGEARVQMRRGSSGGGYLEGLGFYIDRQMQTRRVDTGESGTGFLGPFVYIKVSLVDLASATVLREDIISASRGFSAARSETNDPWSALTADQKALMLTRVLQGELGRVVTRIVATMNP